MPVGPLLVPFGQVNLDHALIFTTMKNENKKFNLEKG
jgi:hypothetical protein